MGYEHDHEVDQPRTIQEELVNVQKEVGNTVSKNTTHYTMMDWNLAVPARSPWSGMSYVFQ